MYVCMYVWWYRGLWVEVVPFDSWLLHPTGWTGSLGLTHLLNSHLLAPRAIPRYLASAGMLNHVRGRCWYGTVGRKVLQIELTTRTELYFSATSTHPRPGRATVEEDPGRGSWIGVRRRDRRTLHPSRRSSTPMAGHPPRDHAHPNDIQAWISWLSGGDPSGSTVMTTGPATRCGAL